MISIKENINSHTIKRFFGYIKIDSPDKCWLWTGSTDSKGRGKIKSFGKELIAPRIMYFLMNGKDPVKEYICHSCDNEMCVNPSHLWAGNNSLNQKDAENGDR